MFKLITNFRSGIPSTFVFKSPHTTLEDYSGFITLPVSKFLFGSYNCRYQNILNWGQISIGNAQDFNRAVVIPLYYCQLNGSIVRTDCVGNFRNYASIALCIFFYKPSVVVL